MKVLVISHMYPSFFNEVAGIFVHEQVKALMAKGVEVRVVSPVPWAPFPIKYLRKKWKRLSQVPQQAQWDGVGVAYPRYLAFPRAWLFATSGKRMYRGIKKLVHEIHREFPFELIHAHVALPDGYAGALIAREIGVPLVVTVHGQDAYATIHWNSRCREAVHWVLEEANRVIVVSSPLRTALEKELGSLQNVVVIHNGVSAEIYGSSSFRAGSSKVVLSVGYLIERKGHEFVLKALARLRSKHPDVRYIIVGTGPRKNKLQKLATSLGLHDRVHFKGLVPHDQLSPIFASCDVFALPSWNEAFGVVYIEAMANGKPVIGCRGEGIEDFVEHGKTGLLVKPCDVDSLVEALDYLLSHPEEARAMGERARKVVLENYTWEKNAEKTIQIYREVLNGR